MSSDMATADIRGAMSDQFFMRIMGSLMIGMINVFTCVSCFDPPRRGYCLLLMRCLLGHC